MQIIPFKDPSKWSMQLAIEGVNYFFKFRWNALNKFWVMGIYDGSNIPLISGIKIVPDFDLTEQFVTSGLFTGDIFCLAIMDIFDRIQRYDMGRKAELFYYTEAELNALLQAS